MNAPFIISENVIHTLNALPQEERVAVSSALVADLIFGHTPSDGLTPLQKVLYGVIRRYVMQDSAKMLR